jgi:hypothetical protein
MLSGEGLAGPEEGFVVDFSSDPPLVTDGPYGRGAKALIGPRPTPDFPAARQLVLEHVLVLAT